MFALAAAASTAAPLESVDGAAFFEPFSSDWESRWLVSKDADFQGTWIHEAYTEPEGTPGDKGLMVGNEAKKHAVSHLFKEPIDPKGTGLVVQYELHMKKDLKCGGAYLKLLTASEELDHDGFKAETPYTIMFGPDKCGGTNKVHFILRHKSPATGEWEEKHLKKAPTPLLAVGETHLYTAIVGADNTVTLLIDNEEKVKASLLESDDFTPPVNPPKEIDDPDDKKPDDWVDTAKIDDPEASKPDDWDEDAPMMIEDPKAEKPESWLDDAPLQVPDPEAEPPDDWDEEEDGEWEAPIVDNPDCKEFGCGEWKAPQIRNPDYKGKWTAPKVDNPEYKGVWKPKQIANPGYFSDEQPHAMAPIGGIGIELWTMQDGALFDNILISTDPAPAKVAAEAFAARSEAEKAAKKAKQEAAEAERKAKEEERKAKEAKEEEEAKEKAKAEAEEAKENPEKDEI